MLSIDPTKLGERDSYKLLIGSIAPRPIALVSTLAKDGVLNVAPFSYFSIVSSAPPLVSVSVQRRNDEMKDTARNAKEQGELVIHIVSESNVEAANRTAATLPPQASEAELAGLTPVASEAVAVPGIAEALLRMECKLERAIELGGSDGSPGCDLLIARVVRFVVDEAVYENGRIDARRLAPVGRMAGNYYSRLGELFELERP